MRNKKFYDLAQAQSYLTHTIIRVNGVPVWIEDVTKGQAGYRISYCHLDEVGLRTDAIMAEDEAVDMNPVPLGMVNVSINANPNAFFLSRAPVRKWKIGLARENADLRNVHGDACGMATMQNVLPSIGLARTIMDQFPKFTKALDTFKRYRGSVAFSRRFAVTSDLHLFFSGYREPVGSIVGGKPYLSDAFVYLKEILEEDIARH